MLNDVLPTVKPGGILLLNLPMIDSLAARILGRGWPLYLEVHLSYFTNKTLGMLLDKCGFAIVGHVPYFQTLTAGYLAEHMGTPWLTPNKIMGKYPITYNMGQRTVVARRAVNDRVQN